MTFTIGFQFGTQIPHQSLMGARHRERSSRSSLSLPNTPSALAWGARSGRLILDDRVPEPAFSRRGLAVQDEGAAGSRDHHAAASAERAASARTLEAEADGGGPTSLCLALSPVSVGVERCHDYPTGDHHSMASDGLPTVLAMEVALSGRPAEDTRGDPAPDPGDELGQSAVGCAPHPWRTAEARDRGRTVDRRQVHGEHRLGQLVA